MCQDSPTMSRAVRISGRISSTCGALLHGIFLTTPAISASDMDTYSPGSSDSASTSEDFLVGFRSSSKCSFHQVSPSFQPHRGDPGQLQQRRESSPSLGVWFQVSPTVSCLYLSTSHTASDPIRCNV